MQHLLRAVGCVLDCGFVPTEINENTAKYGDLFCLYKEDCGNTQGRVGIVQIEWCENQLVWEQLQLTTWGGWCYNEQGFAPHVKKDFVRLLHAYRMTVESGEYQDEPDEDEDDDLHLGAGLSEESCKQLKTILVMPVNPPLTVSKEEITGI